MSTTRPQPQTDRTPPVTEDPAVAGFLERLHAAYRTPPDREVAHQHLELMLAEVAGRAPAPTPWWRRPRLAVGRIARRAAAVGAVKLALGAGLAAAATGGGLAATGNLPPTAQHAVAEVLGRLGLELPDPAAGVVDDTPAGGEAPPGRSGDGQPPGPQRRPDDVPPAREDGAPNGAGSDAGSAGDDARDRARERRSEGAGNRPDRASAPDTAGAGEADEASDPDPGQGPSGVPTPDESPGGEPQSPGEQGDDRASGSQRGGAPDDAGIPPDPPRGP